MRIESTNNLNRKPATPPPPDDPAPEDDVAEVGADKTPHQHAGNIAFGTASLLSTVGHVKNLLRISSRTPIAKAVPGLNLVAAVIEGGNAVHKFRQGDKVVAATSAGNAVGTLATFFDESAWLALQSKQVGLGASLAAAGGVLGLAAGAYEIHHGLKLKRKTGSTRTLTMGTLDISSGVLSLTGAALAARSYNTTLASTLLLTSGLIDLSGIAVDYLWPGAGARK